MQETQKQKLELTPELQEIKTKNNLMHFQIQLRKLPNYERVIKIKMINIQIKCKTAFIYH